MNIHSAAGRAGGTLAIDRFDQYGTGSRLCYRTVVSYAPQNVSIWSHRGPQSAGEVAIAAVAPAVKANEKETSVSLGVVFLLNSVALLLFPLLGHWLGLTQHQFGLWSAIAIHDTSSVVGASSAYGSEALNVATTVKLARALWIIPVSLLSALLFRSSGKKFRFRGHWVLYRGDATEQLPAVRRDVQYAAHYGV